MRVFVRSILFLLLLACVDQPATLQPWEPIDPGFIGCEGG
jgi:hypothetical protein